MLQAKIRKKVFFPPFILLTTVAFFGIFDPESLLVNLKVANDFILQNFGWWFSYMAFALVLSVFVIPFSKFGKQKIGGEKATRILKPWQLFAVTLCTTVAVGILLWATSEPIKHLVNPASFANAKPLSVEAINFSISTMFLHWTITPYAITILPAILFAYVFYNQDEPFSLGSVFTPLFGKKAHKYAYLLDAICLYCMVAGMAASLGSAILIFKGAVENLAGIEGTPLLNAGITLVIVISFTLSAATGILKGIKYLSMINLSLFILFMLYVVSVGPTNFMFSTAFSGIKSYLIEFVPRSIAYGESGDMKWLQENSNFFWAVWMAWAPVTAMFIGKISRGYRINQIIMYCFLLPVCFSFVWMSVFSTTSIYYELYEGANFARHISGNVPELIVFELIQKLPGASFLVAFFMILTFMSFVTAADSTVSAMSLLSTQGLDKDELESPLKVKVMWSVIMGSITWVMVSYAGVQGIMWSSNLGGLPALFILTVMLSGFWLTLIKSQTK